MSRKIVDLSLTLNEVLPTTWPGHIQYSHKNWNWYGQNVQVAGKSRNEFAYKTNFVIIDEHSGTHFDAPTHFLPPSKSGLDNACDLGDNDGEKVDLTRLIGKSRCYRCFCLKRYDW